MAPSDAETASPSNSFGRPRPGGAADFPKETASQESMHNDLMKAVRLTIRAVSEARVQWMSAKRPREADVLADPDAGPARAPRRAGADS